MNKYQEFFAEDCGNCWLMAPDTDKPYYCNKTWCTTEEEESRGDREIGE